MDFQSTIILSTTSSGLALSGYAPFTLTLNPSAWALSNKLVKILYQWGTDTDVVTLIPSLSSNSLTLPFSAEKGDPRNFPVSHQFLLTSVSAARYNIGISAYQMGLSAPSAIALVLEVYQPNSLSTILTGLKLVDARMFGSDDQVLYVLESTTPNFIYPILVQWDTSTVIAPETTNDINIQLPPL